MMKTIKCKVLNMGLVLCKAFMLYTKDKTCLQTCNSNSNSNGNSNCLRTTGVNSNGAANSKYY